ncbi:4-hydroxybenzoate-- benzoate-- ligase [Fusarium flagelliforme]|uniref:4-hydroxybenzoate--benzoate--ligase n=1 Tax=Fusarium flagelliforme TaxID=2675880 RepID=A0A395N2L3_9HYPO|nr:4-hydroxybenzoate-- benzoate-- ligase [Fusarium flagelliforme]
MRTFHTPLSVIQSLAQSRGDSPAVRYADQSGYQTISYTEYWQNINDAAKNWTAELSRADIAKGSVVGLWMKGLSYEDLLHYLSLMRAGYVPQLFSIRMQDPSIVFELLVKSGAKALLHDPDCEPLIKECPLPTIPISGVVGRAPPDIYLNTVTTSANGDHVLVIFHTSGSTSLPKLVPQTVRWLECLIRKHQYDRIRDSPDSVISAIGSHAHLGNTIILAVALAAGSCLLLPTNIPYSPFQLDDMITNGGLTILSIFPGLLLPMFAEARHNDAFFNKLQGLEKINFAGRTLEPKEEAWARDNGLKLINFYGSTEIGASMMSTSTSPYVSPLAESGCEFIPFGETSSGSDQLFQLIIPAESDDCPHPSLRNKSDGKFHSGDVFQRVGNDQYIYKGRVDDRIKMQLGQALDAGSLEADVMQNCENDLISAVSVIGSGRLSPAIVVEPKDNAILEAGDDNLLALKNQIIFRTALFQKQKYAHVWISDARLIFVVAKGTLPRTPKGNVMRMAVEKMFAKELDQCFPTTS